MGRRLKILDRHAELCELIEAWVRNELKRATSGLGYPTQSFQFVYKPPGQPTIDPTGYSVQDHEAIARALEALSQTDRDLWATVKMHYMPWSLAALVAEGHIGPPNKVFFDDLLRAHVWLEGEWRANLSLARARNKAYAEP